VAERKADFMRSDWGGVAIGLFQLAFKMRRTPGAGGSLVASDSPGLNPMKSPASRLLRTGIWSQIESDQKLEG
jgi:hypothetical protein